MYTNSAVVGALAVVFALAGCAQVAPSSPGDTPLAALAAATPVQVSHGNGPFRIEWEITGPGKIGGRIYNEYQDGAYQFQLLVQGLDASNRVVNQSYLWVGGDIGPLDGRSFMLTKLQPADHYWVTVHSYQIRQAGGCCTSNR
jgi:hypothetical protein